MTDKLIFLELYMTDVRDPEEVSYGDLFPYFDQIRGDHQPAKSNPTIERRPMIIAFVSKKIKRKKNTHTL